MPEEFRSPRASQSPSAYREQNPYKPPPPEYNPPSMLAEHRGLAIILAVASIAFAVYCLKGPTRPRNLPRTPIAQSHTPAAAAPAPAQPIYIEAIPEKDAR